MTGQVDALSRKGVPLATDSAVTIGINGKEKAFNTGEKLFELIKNKPRGM